MKRITIGRTIAFALAVVVVGFFWERLFPPGGSGSNVVLGILVAVIGISFIAKQLGNYLDDHFFHGGSKERALLTRRAEQFVETSRNDFERFVKKHKRKGFDQTLAANWKARTDELLALTRKTRANFGKEEQTIQSQISALKLSIENVENAMKAAQGRVHKHGLLSGSGSLALALLAALAFRAFIIEPFQIPSGSMYPTLLVGDHLFVSKLSYGVPNPFSSQPGYFFRWAEPKPGDVIVFQAPSYVGRNAGEAWIKRVIAGPGQRVRVKDTIVYVDDKPYAHVAPEELVTYMDFHDISIESGLLGSHARGKWGQDRAIRTKEQIGSLVHDIFLSPLDGRLEFEANWPNRFGRNLTGLTCTMDECRVNEGHVFVMGDNRGNSADGRVWGALPIDNIKGKAKFIWISVDGSKRLLDLGRFTLPGFRWERTFNGIG